MEEVFTKSRLIDRLKGAIDVESAMAFCYSHLGLLIKNGRIRRKFFLYAETSKEREKALLERLHKLGIKDFVLKEKCKFCKINPESFSLLGALNLGIDIVSVGIKFYKELVSLSDSLEDKKFFQRLLREKVKQRDFLRKERKVTRPEKSSIIEYRCIPEIISRLWK